MRENKLGDFSNFDTPDNIIHHRSEILAMSPKELADFFVKLEEDGSLEKFLQEAANDER